MYATPTSVDLWDMHMLRQSGVRGSELGEAVAGGAVFGDHQDPHSEDNMSVCSERPPVSTSYNNLFYRTLRKSHI